MLLKLYSEVHTILENLQFALFASIAKALMQPLETRSKTILMSIATCIIGTLLAQSALEVPFLHNWAFGIATATGLFGKEFFDFAIDYIKNKDKFSSLFKK